MTEDTQRLIREVCSDIADFLVEKNKAYGNSALAPSRIFARSGTKEQIYVRIDDKLNRIMKGSECPGDNDIDDLLGYLILLKVYERMQGDEQGGGRRAEAEEKSREENGQEDREEGGEEGPGEEGSRQEGSSEASSQEDGEEDHADPEIVAEYGYYGYSSRPIYSTKRWAK